MRNSSDVSSSRSSPASSATTGRDGRIADPRSTRRSITTRPRCGRLPGASSADRAPHPAPPRRNRRPAWGAGTACRTGPHARRARRLDCWSSMCSSNSPAPRPSRRVPSRRGGAAADTSCNVAIARASVRARRSRGDRVTPHVPDARQARRHALHRERPRSAVGRSARARAVAPIRSRLASPARCTAPPCSFPARSACAST